MAFRRVSITHWFPIVTICPVNNLPDLIYITVDFDNDPVVNPQFNELYSVRKRIRKIASWKRAFMEDIADEMFNEFRGCSCVTVTLLFNRHTVIRAED